MAENYICYGFGASIGGKSFATSYKDYEINSENDVYMYARHWENKLQVLTKMIVTYKDAQNCTIVFTMNRGTDYWVSLSV